MKTTEIKVTCCADCIFIQHSKYSSTCSRQELKENTNILDTIFNLTKTPSWCPLKQGDINITLVTGK